MVRVLLINPDSNIEKLVGKHYASYAVPVPPAGIAYIAGSLEAEGHDVLCYDAYANRPSDEEFLKLIFDFSPDIIGFSCLTLAMKNIARLYRLLKQEGCKAPVVLGNAHVSILPRETLENGTGDIIVRGEGEETMAELVRVLEKGGDLKTVRGITFRNDDGEIIATRDRPAVRKLDSLPLPVWDDFDLSIYKAAAIPLSVFEGKRPLPVMASRGCMYSCEFCAQDYAFKGLRVRSLEKVVDEVEYLHETYGCDCVGFLDACFPLSEKQGLEFCRLYKERGLHKKVIWFSETRVNIVTERLLEAMADAGCRMVQYGFESGSQEILDKINKQATLEEAESAVKYTRKAGILAYGLFMLGNRGETYETCMQTIKFARHLGCDLAKFNLVIPYPGSPLYYIYLAEQRGELKFSTDRFTGFFDLVSEGSDPMYVPEGMTAKELIHLQKKAMLMFYTRPGLVFRYLTSNIVSRKEMLKGGYILIHDILKSWFKNSRISGLIGNLFGDHHSSSTVGEKSEAGGAG